MDSINIQTPIYRLVYALIILLVTIIIAEVFVVKLMSGQEEVMRDRVNGYHQSSISTLLELDDAINEARLWIQDDSRGSPGYPPKDYSTLTKRDVLIVMQKRVNELVGKIRRMQADYAGPEFEFLIQRMIIQNKSITDKVVVLTSLNELPDFTYEELVYGIHITSHQLRALHKVYYSRLENKIRWFDERQVFIISVTTLIAIVLAVGIFLYMMRLIGNAIETRDKVTGRLQESEEQYKTLARVSPVGIFHTDQQGSCTYVNERWCEMAGMNEAQAHGEGWIQALHPDDREAVFNEWHQATIDDRSFRMECRFKSSDGRVTWLFAQAEVELDRGGRVVGYVGTTTDISEAHFAEQQLRQSQENMAAFASNIREGILINLDGCHVYTNEFMNKMLGYNDGGLLGSTIEDVVHPDYQDKIKARFKSRMSGHDEPNQYETVFIKRDGTAISVELTASKTTWQGRPAGLVAVRDISESKRIAAELRRERDLSRAVLDSAGALIVVLDKEGRIEQFNHMCEAVTLYDFAEVEGRYVWEILFEEDEKDAITVILSEISSGQAQDRYKLWLTTKSHEKRLIDWSSAMVSDEETGLQKIIGIGIDITERQLMEDRLISSEYSLARAQEISNTGNWEWDITLNTLQWSDQIYQIFGIRKRSVTVTYDDFIEAVHPRDRQVVEQAVLDSIADNTIPYDIAHRIVRPDGKVRYVHELGEIIRDADGNAIRMIGTVQDRTVQTLAERALQQFKHTLDQTLDCVFIFDTENLCFVYVNEGAMQQVGYTDEELLTMHPYDIKPEVSEQQFRELLAPLISGEQPSLSFEAIHRHKNGRHVPVEIFLQFIKQEDESSRFIAIVRDITERKAAEMKLNETSRLLDNIVENVPNMIFLKSASDLRFKFFNRAGEKLLGLDRSEILGRNDYDFFPKKQADLFTSKDREVLQQHAVIDIPEEAIETSRGARVLHTKKITLRDKQGEPEYLLGISDDITERKQTERALQESELRMGNIYSSLGEAVLVVDLDRKLVNVNDAAKIIFGYSDQELLNASTEMFHVDHQHYMEFGERINMAFNDNETAKFEFEAKRKNGEVFPTAHTVSLLKDPDGEPKGIVSVIRDISVRVQTETALKNTLAEKEVLLRELHHRVKNILQIISSLISMQSRKIRSKPAREAFIETRDRIRAVALIYEKLFGESNLSEIDVKEYIEYIAGRLDQVYEASKRGISTEITGDALILSMEKALPCGLIANELLTNIYKHAFPDGGSGHASIEISLDDQGNCGITVKDDGIGIKDGNKTGGSFGMEIMATLAGQIDARLDISHDKSPKHGTIAKLIFVI